MKSQTVKQIIIIAVVGIGLYLLDLSCPFHAITGLDCPGCGITRMFISLLHLEFYQAFRYNPLVFIYLIGYIIYIIINIYNRKFRNKNMEISDKVIYILIIIAVLFSVLRNIELFSYLRPTIV